MNLKGIKTWAMLKNHKADGKEDNPGNENRLQ